MKTILHAITGKPVVIEPACRTPAGSWAFCACAVCGIGVEIDLKFLLAKRPIAHAHGLCYETAIDIEAENPA